MTGSFLAEPPASPEVQALFDEDLADDGYVGSVSRLWAHQPDTLRNLFQLMSRAFAWPSPRSTTPSAPSPTRSSPGPCPRRYARP